MDKVLQGILYQNKWLLAFWAFLALAFSGLCWWKFYCGVEIQAQLAVMTGSLWTMLFTAIQKVMGGIEKATGLDIDKDGTVGSFTQGLEGLQKLTGATTQVQTATSQAVYIPQEVASYDAECDASKYNLC